MAHEPDALAAALSAFAAADAPEIVEAARADAHARVRAALADAMANALLDRARELLAPAYPERSAAGEEGWYVFGVIRGEHAAAPAGTRLVREGGLAAVARPVALAEYGEEALKANLNDIAWLEEAARAHEAVLDELLRDGTVIPLRLCTVYRSEEAVRDMLAAERGALEEALARLAGRTEWGVKAFRSVPVAPAAGAAPADGAAYMEARRREADERRRAREVVGTAVEEAHVALSAIAEEALANPLQRRELTGRDDDMVLNGVYLVDDERVDELRAAVDELDGDGVTFELTGPWPPYNFIKRSVDAAR
jgi:hypothetical protein